MYILPITDVLDLHTYGRAQLDYGRAQLDDGRAQLDYGRAQLVLFLPSVSNTWPGFKLTCSQLSK